MAVTFNRDGSNLPSKAEMAHSAFQPLNDFRETAGKQWIAPSAYFRSDVSLYMPNFRGYTLTNSQPTGTTATLQGNISVVRLFTSLPGEQQTKTYFNGDPNSVQEDGFQIVDMNLVENRIKEFFVKAFMGSIRKSTNSERQPRYFICRQGVTPELRGLIGAKNIYPGYVYLVDRDCKIRWAACGDATAEEIKNLWRFVQSLKKENPSVN